MSLSFFSVYNIEQFQYLMYRPLYWFGTGATPNLNPRSPWPRTPTYINTTNTVPSTSSNYKWSNGETVTAQNVMFWMNMLQAEKANWAGVLAGRHARRRQEHRHQQPDAAHLHADRPGNNYWFTYNELSQITPMPNAWDITATGRRAPTRAAARAGALRDRPTRPVHGGVHLPVQAVRLRPVQPEGGQQLAVHLRHQPALAGRRRPVEADRLRRRAAT